MAYRVLFLCTHNSARSILFASALNHAGGARFEASSAGSQPAGAVNPYALAELERRGMPTADARSKSWDEFTRADAPAFDLVVTVCDSAAREACPVFFGDFAKAHWGLPDPSAVTGQADRVERAFSRTADVVIARAQALAALPVETMDRGALQPALAEIEVAHPARTLEDVRHG
jgi:arsenate reductase